ncbi:MAG TPA: ComEC/Rec2 family competence protein [Arcobacter sp.]|nr:ComEC/Rec2 family competence protein [Arcobacter sp.]HIP56101.1 ComEC/Rec2 family competence protein [Arcobacter sp.]
MEPLPLATNKKEWFYIVFALLLVFVANISYEYTKYKDFKSEEIYTTTAKIINIYPKRQYDIVKLQSSNLTFFTKYKQKPYLNKLDLVEVTIVTKKVKFIDYLKGFYASSFNIQLLPSSITIQKILSSNIESQHKSKEISELFNALFFAIPTSKEIKQICASYGVSHLVAISGFHLGVLSFILYWILYILYTPLKRRYFPYRNIRFDLLIATSLVLFTYLLFLGLVPSFLRAFVMFILGIFFLRSNIKIVSFQTLGLVVLFIIALFPKLLFSLSLWFSVAGVFYIFLFLQYFKNMNKVFQFLLFNVWIYLAMNPITHFFFGTTSLEQLYSPIFTLGFSIFYPLEVFLHIIDKGSMLDMYLQIWLDTKVITKEIFTPLWVFIVYIIISFFSIPCPKWFRTLNLSFIAFNLWLYISYVS